MSLLSTGESHALECLPVDVVVVGVARMNTVCRQLGIAFRIATATTVGTGRIWSQLVFVRIIVVVLIEIDEFAGQLMVLLIRIHVHLRFILLDCTVFVLIDHRFIDRRQLVLMRQHRLFDVMRRHDGASCAMVIAGNRLVRMQLCTGHRRRLMLHDRWNAHR